MNNMNLLSIKNFGKYGLESIAIIVSVLFSFYLEDLRVTNEKTNYKNELVKNLKAIINEDLINIQNIKELQQRAYAGADLIINDMIDGKMDFDKKEIAENYLLVGQRGWVSFFPQNGSYTECTRLYESKFRRSQEKAAGQKEAGRRDVGLID